ncbi:MAG: PspC domain-containing protein [Actinomycetota bacterium]
MSDEGEKDVDAGINGGAGPEPAAAAAGPQAARKHLTRSRTSRMFAGVCGGIGEYLGVDPILVRLGFAVLALLGGAGVGLYLVAWVLIPLEGEPRSVGEEALAKGTAYLDREFGDDKDRSWLWITLLVIGGLMVISNLGRMGWYDGAWFWAILLIAGGVWLYRQETYGPRTTPDQPVDPAVAAATTNPPGGTATTAGMAGTATAQTATAQTAYPARPAPKVRPVKPKVPPSRLGRYTFALGLVVLGSMAMLDNTGAFDLSPGQYSAAALITAGAGLIVGSVWGRARSLIFWGLLLVPFVIFADTTHIPFGNGSGERTYSPVLPTEAADEYELFAGHLVIDLEDMRWGPEPVTVNAGLFMGQMEIFVPEGVDVKFDGHTQMGGVHLFGLERTGTDVNLRSDQDSGDGPELILNTDVFMGEIVVHRTAETAKEQL